MTSWRVAAALVLLVLVLALAGRVADRASTPRLVAFGHSFVVGDGDPANPWVKRVAKAEGFRLDNLGQSGRSSAAIRATVEAFKPESSDVIVIEAAINDVRQGGEDQGALAAYRDNVLAMVAHLQAGGPEQILLVADPPPTQWQDGTLDQAAYAKGSDSVLAAYNAVTQEIAAATGTTFVPVPSGWDRVADVSPYDTLHPDGSGNAKIAAAVRAAITFPN